MALRLPRLPVTVLPDPGPKDPAGLAVRAALGRGVARLIELAPGALGGEVGAVHQARVASRRLRSHLRTFGPLLDPEWSAPLAEELRWLGGALGAVRDLDVLTAHLEEHAGRARRQALRPLFEDLGRQHAVARAALREALEGPRFGALCERLSSAAAGPVLVGPHDEPCREVLPPLVAAVWKKLAKAGRALGPEDPDAAYHRVRIRAKRARYAAEAVAPALGERVGASASRFARAAERIQELLGTHQDAVVAAEVVRNMLAEHPGDRAFGEAAAKVLAREQAIVCRCRERFPDAWDRLDRKRCLKWLEGM